MLVILNLPRGLLSLTSMQLPILSGIGVLHNIKSQPRFLAVARQPSCFGISELTKMAETFTAIRKEKAE